jgi:two-component system OmpR family sensor kinase
MNDIRVPIGSDADAVTARQRGREAALRIGLSRTEATYVATAISEIARNITTHAGAGEIVIQEVRDASRIGIVVIARDEGPGIADADRPRVFERFYRADRSRSRERGGSGLGLSIVAAVVAAHGGDVDVQSTPGEGTTIRVRLPATS